MLFHSADTLLSQICSDLAVKLVSSPNLAKPVTQCGEPLWAAWKRGCFWSRSDLSLKVTVCRESRPKVGN